ncbi:hypothetical protein [Terricaulis silvestris]|nr:hypothetical protein [Terricaulis silvestris]
MEKAVAKDFEAKPKIAFDAAGLVYEFDAPMSVVASPAGREMAP